MEPLEMRTMKQIKIRGEWCDFDSAEVYKFLAGVCGVLYTALWLENKAIETDLAFFPGKFADVIGVDPFQFKTTDIGIPAWRAKTIEQIILAADDGNITLTATTREKLLRLQPALEYLQQYQWPGRLNQGQPLEEV